MPHCPECRQPLGSLDLRSGRCPRCDARLPTEEPSSPAWRTIARFANLAEVGYFADLLEAQSIKTRVHHQRQFDALAGYWQTTYELSVAATDGEAAIAVLHEELDGDAPADEEHGVPGTWREMEPPHVFATDSRSSVSSGWRIGSYILCALLAGGTGYWLGQTHVSLQSDALERTRQFWRAVAAASPLHSEDSPLRPRYVLRYDKARHVFVLESKGAGNGLKERTSRELPVP